jgi:hypothetical protein
MMLTDGQYNDAQLRHQKERAMKALGIIQQRLENITRQQLALDQQQQQQQPVVDVASSSGPASAAGTLTLMASAATDSNGGSGGGGSTAVAGASSGSKMLACVDELADSECDADGDSTANKHAIDEVCSVYSMI